MKGCADYRAHIQFYLDKELRGPSLEEFCSHMEQCADCRHELEAEEERLRSKRHIAMDALEVRFLPAF